MLLDRVKQHFASKVVFDSTVLFRRSVLISAVTSLRAERFAFRWFSGYFLRGQNAAI